MIFLFELLLVLCVVYIIFRVAVWIFPELGRFWQKANYLGDLEAKAKIEDTIDKFKEYKHIVKEISGLDEEEIKKAADIVNAFKQQH